MLMTSIPRSSGSGEPQSRARFEMHQSSASGTEIPLPESFSTFTSTKRASGATPTA